MLKVTNHTQIILIVKSAQYKITTYHNNYSDYITVHEMQTQDTNVINYTSPCSVFKVFIMRITIVCTH